MTRISPTPPDHGGGVDAAAQRHGGTRAQWIDLSTGINPVPYPVPPIAPDAWGALPDHNAMADLIHAARAFWRVPDGAAILAAPGASSIIARLPALSMPSRISIPGPTYNEHARAFTQQGWAVDDTATGALVVVHPNNPDGRLATAPAAAFCIIDESFCDVMPDASLIALATRPGTIVLKSFGKFWGLAGVRLGFAIGDPTLIAQLAALLGPWPVSGPALTVGTAALCDTDWAAATRIRLAQDAAKLDQMMGTRLVGGTTLFRLYDLPDAAAWQEGLARHHIWTRTFPYNPRWLRLGLPGTPAAWARLAVALHGMR